MGCSNSKPPIVHHPEEKEDKSAEVSQNTNTRISTDGATAAPPPAATKILPNGGGSKKNRSKNTITTSTSIVKNEMSDNEQGHGKHQEDNRMLDQYYYYEPPPLKWRLESWQKFKPNLSQKILKMVEGRQTLEAAEQAKAASATETSEQLNQWTQQERRYRKGKRQLLEENQEWQGQQRYEEAIESGAIALVNAEWLIDYAYNNLTTITMTRSSDNNNSNDIGSSPPPIPCRNNLPQEAFFTLDQIQRFKQEIDIVALSYMWLQPNHPDPLGTTLRLVANQCINILYLKQLNSCPGYNNNPQLAIFWDYLSLYQHPNPAKGIHRTLEQEALFKHGLSSLAGLYSHPKVKCWKVTKFPTGYPKQYHMEQNKDIDNNNKMNPSSQQVASYYDRGWPYIESLWTSMTKSERQTIDLCIDGDNNNGTSISLGSRPPPTLPQQAWERLQHVSFSNAKADRPLVYELYQTEFERWFGTVTHLQYANLGWKMAQAVQLARVLAFTPHLQKLILKGNALAGAEGCLELSRALQEMYQVRLQQDREQDDDDHPNSKKSDHEAGEDEILPANVLLNEKDLETDVALKLALFRTAHIKLTLPLPSPNFGDMIAKDLLRKHNERILAAMNADDMSQNDHPPPILQELDLQDNPQLGDEGIVALKNVIPYCTQVNLQQTGLGVAGCQAIVQQRGESFPLVEKLILSRNSGIGDEGILGLVMVVSSSMLLRRLKQLWLSDCSVTDHGCQILANAFAAMNEDDDSPPACEDLDLSKNTNMSDLSISALQTILENCPKLRYLRLDGQFAASSLHVPTKSETRLIWIGEKKGKLKK